MMRDKSGVTFFHKMSWMVGRIIVFPNGVVLNSGGGFDGHHHKKFALLLGVKEWYRPSDGRTIQRSHVTDYGNDCDGANLEILLDGMRMTIFAAESSVKFLNEA